MSRLSLLAALLTGCASGPLSGTWLYSNSELRDDSCGIFDEGVVLDGDFYIYNEGKGSMVIDPNDDSEIFSCTYDKSSFSCPERLQQEEIVQGSTLTGTAEVVGTLDKRESASGSQLLSIDCDGPTCEAFEAAAGQTFPCTAEVVFSATWTSPTLP